MKTSDHVAAFHSTYEDVLLSILSVTAKIPYGFTKLIFLKLFL